MMHQIVRYICRLRQYNCDYNCNSICFPRTDVDECTLNTDDCHATFATCTNTDGSFTCTCNTGYDGDGVTCTGESCNEEIIG